jgi:hypothetical protein
MENSFCSLFLENFLRDRSMEQGLGKEVGREGMPSRNRLKAISEVSKDDGEF